MLKAKIISKDDGDSVSGTAHVEVEGNMMEIFGDYVMVSKVCVEALIKGEIPYETVCDMLNGALRMALEKVKPEKAKTGGIKS